MNLLGGLLPGSLSYIGLFVGALLIYDGLWQLLSRGDARRSARSRRMRMIAAGASAKDILQVLRPDLGQGAFDRLPLLGRLARDLRRAGITVEPALLLVGFAAGAVVTALAASRLFPPALAAGFAAAIWGLLPYTLLRSKLKSRQDLFGRQLPEALELMARGLRVGHPLNVTIASVAEEMADPIATEFGLIVDQVAYGSTLVDAVLDLAERMPTEDMRYLASAISIQHGTGGDLARMLSTLSRVIRDRMTLRRKVRSISAEGRLSALLLSAIPFLMLGGMTILSPHYYGDIADDPVFKPLALAVLALVVLNALVLRRLVNFRF